jgi:hypothetical protein
MLTFINDINIYFFLERFVLKMQRKRKKENTRISYHPRVGAANNPQAQG